MNKTKFAIFASSVICNSVMAHQNNELKQTELVAKAALVARSGEVPDQAAYQLPGFMMGGESYSVETGFNLDDIQVLGTKNFDGQYFVSAKLGSHQHGSDSELSVENLWFGTKLWNNSLTLEAGKMATDVTSTANYHTAQDDFTEAPLLADVYFGRHHYDTGIRATFNVLGAQFGAEYFSGESWPFDGETSDGVFSLFSRYELQLGAHQLSARIWGLSGEVESRSDLRLTSDHHSDTDINTTLVPADFGGDVALAGAMVTYQYYGAGLSVNTEFEIITADQEGIIDDGNQVGLIDSQTTGYRFKQSFTHLQHQVNLQYEFLVADNSFVNTSSLMVESIGLYNEDFEPTRLLVNWRWQFNRDFTLVTEYNQEQITPENEQTRFALGLIWNWQFL